MHTTVFPMTSSPCCVIRCLRETWVDLYSAIKGRVELCAAVAGGRLSKATGDVSSRRRFLKGRCCEILELKRHPLMKLTVVTLRRRSHERWRGDLDADYVARFLHLHAHSEQICRGSPHGKKVGVSLSPLTVNPCPSFRTLSLLLDSSHSESVAMICDMCVSWSLRCCRYLYLFPSQCCVRSAKNETLCSLSFSGSLFAPFSHSRRPGCCGTCFQPLFAFTTKNGSGSRPSSMRMMRSVGCKKGTIQAPKEGCKEGLTREPCGIERETQDISRKLTKSGQWRGSPMPWQSWTELTAGRLGPRSVGSVGWSSAEVQGRVKLMRQEILSQCMSRLGTRVAELHEMGH